MEACQRTIGILDAMHDLPEWWKDCLDNIATEMAPLADRNNMFSDPNIGEHLCSSTVLAYSEQLYRHRVGVDLLGTIVTGEYGRILSGIMIASLAKSKKRSKSEGIKAGDPKYGSVFIPGKKGRAGKWETVTNQGQGSRTKWSNRRNFWDEIETIQETAICLLWGSVDKLRFACPIEMGPEPEPIESGFLPASVVRKLRKREKDGFNRAWCSFNAYCPVSGISTFAAHMDNVERDLLLTIIANNQEHENDPNRWQFCLFPNREAELVCDLFQNEDIRTIRRVKSSLSSGLSGCVISAFGAAATRFILLEYGHTTELPKLMREPRSVTRRNREVVEFNETYTTSDMVPIELREELESGSTPLQRAIIRVATEEPVNKRREVFEVLNTQLENPVGFRQFAENWTAIMKRARKLGSD